jgi:hypothetical protein
VVAVQASPSWGQGGPPSLSVQPSTIELRGQDSQHGLLVSLRHPDGRITDVTEQAQLKPEDERVVAVVAPGQLRALHHGTTRVHITVGEQATTLTVSVREAVPLVPSFIRDIEPLLTRQGCNQGACHGKGSGQNGFRLSLRGYAPELDHRWLTREFAARRVGPSPEESLLLRKATGQVPHEGGMLFGPRSREAKLLGDWLAASMPGPRPDEPRLTKLELLPGSGALAVGQSQRLLALAHFSDGSVRDVTWLTRFESNDAGQLEVTPSGRVQALRAGETAVRANYLSEVAVAVFTTPYAAVVPAERFAQRHNLVDDHVFARLQALHIEPSELCSDAEFVRRVYLDAIGRLPTPAEVRAFLADQRPDRRNRLIDALLERPEYVDYWTMFLGELLQNRRERDHDVRGVKGVRSFHAWLREQVAQDRGWDAIAREVLTAKGKVTEQPAVGYFLVTVGEHPEAPRSEVVAAVAQAFLGTRIGCAQCHNHPLEKYTQDDYYHFAAFFARIRLDRQNPQVGVSVLHIGHRDPQRNQEKPGVIQPRTGQFLLPQPLDRSPMRIEPGEDPRVKLAAWMTDPKNEWFSGAMVNRVWRHYLGVGLVEPVDDLRASNPPSNPALWKALTEYFVQSNYSIKALARLILQSRTYQLSSSTKPGNTADSKFYSHYYARRLPSEVLLDAISDATGVPERFHGYPEGVRAVQVPDPGVASYFLSIFGRSPRVSACACERSSEVTMPQLLHLQNGEALLHKLSHGRLARWLREQKDDQQITEELFLATLSRLPSPAERSAVAALLGDGSPREEVFRDLFWALINSKDFAFNH